MKCSECNCITTSFDERLGETICNDCGLILSVDIFEETSSPMKNKKFFREKTKQLSLGSIISLSDVKSSDNHILYNQHIWTTYNKTERQFKFSSSMFLSYYSGKSFLSEVYLKYKILKEEHLIRGLPIDDVAAGIVYYVLKEKGIPISLKGFSKKSKIPTKNIMRTAKKLTKRFGKAHIFSDLNVEDIISQIILNLNSIKGTPDINNDVRFDCYNFVSYIQRCYDDFNLTFTRTHIITAIWMVGRIHVSLNITQSALKDTCNISVQTIKDTSRKICINLNLDKTKLGQYTIENIISGVR